MRLNSIWDNAGARKKRKIVGRGLGSGKGKTCGKGTKGQTSRTGVAINGFEGGQMPIHRRLPKRGFKNPFKIEYQLINLDDINQMIEDKVIQADKLIDKDVLLASGIVNKKNEPIKLLGNGDLKYKIKIKVDKASSRALEVVKNLGGEVLLEDIA